MATPTGSEIRERALELFMTENTGRGAYEEGGMAPRNPEDSELREGGYFERARNELMRESGRLTPEDRERALQEKERLNEELREVREALGYKPRRKKEKVEALVQAAKSPEAAPVATVDVATRQELEEIPPPAVILPQEESLAIAAALPGPKESRQYFPGRPVPELARQRPAVEPVEVPAVSPEIDEEALAAAAALPRPQRRERYPGRYSAELAAQKMPEEEGPKPPPAHKQLSTSLRGIFRSTKDKLIEYEKAQRARDAENRRLQRDEDRELQQFQREVRLAERKRIVLARATARVERASEQARMGYGTGGGPVGDLARAISRRISPALYSQPVFQGAPEEGVEEEEEAVSGSPYGAAFGRFPTHRYPTYRFPGARRGGRHLHFNIGQTKPGTAPSKYPRIKTSWTFPRSVRSQARPPNYNRGRRPYSFDLVRPEDREIRQEISEAQARLSE